MLLQISGLRDLTLPKVEDVIQQNWLNRREKLLAMGLSYDLANAKGQSSGQTEKADSPRGHVPTNDKPSVSATIQVDPTTIDTSATNTASVDTTLTIEANDPVTAETDQPWDAVCVVALRVFCPGDAATIRVVKPEVATMTMGTKAKLDVDDPEKDATEKPIQKP